MTSQVLMSTRISRLPNVQPVAPEDPPLYCDRPPASVASEPPEPSLSETSFPETALRAMTAKAFYRADQQAKFLHLQAETEALLQHLQALKQQRLAADATKTEANL